MTHYAKCKICAKFAQHETSKLLANRNSDDKVYAKFAQYEQYKTSELLILLILHKVANDKICAKFAQHETSKLLANRNNR